MVEHPTHDFGSGHDPRVMGLSPMLSLLLSFCSSPPLARALSLSEKKKKEKKLKIRTNQVSLGVSLTYKKKKEKKEKKDTSKCN